MKLKPSVKWAIAAAATVTTVTVSMGVIASAYPYDQGVTSGDGFGILGDSNDSKIGSRRNGYDAMILNLRIKSLRWSRWQNLH